MKKVCLFLLVLVLFLLCSCGKDTSTEELQQQYRAISAAEISADIVCHLPTENRTYTVTCNYEKGQGATTSIVAPEEVKGISATVNEKLSVTYDGMILSAGTLTEICPANCLPYLFAAVSEGYITEWGRDTLEGENCLRVTFDTTAPDGGKFLCIVWFYEENQIPVYAEFLQNDQVVLTALIHSFEIV